tara:strand:+ start:2334 stop:2909 length:576 start_codon:yes stop_codon:yes gene_type:complete
MGRLDNYEQVDARLRRVHEQSDKVRIHTKVLDHSENWDRVVVKAFLYEGELLLATGIAMDWKGKDNQANKTNWMEVAETSAIGRCIANSKFQNPNAKRPSREEMEVAQERQGEAAQSPAKEKALTEGNGDARKLGDLLQKNGLTNVVVTNFFEQRGWIKKGQMWSEAPPEKLTQIYERAKSNPEGFVKAIA